MAESRKKEYLVMCNLPPAYVLVGKVVAADTEDEAIEIVDKELVEFMDPETAHRESGEWKSKGFSSFVSTANVECEHCGKPSKNLYEYTVSPS
jgi:hypothetical protein